MLLTFDAEEQNWLCLLGVLYVSHEGESHEGESLGLSNEFAIL